MNIKFNAEIVGCPQVNIEFIPGLQSAKRCSLKLFRKLVTDQTPLRTSSSFHSTV